MNRSIRYRLNLKVRLHKAQGGVCCYCETPLSLEEGTFEHLKRKCEGGTFRVGNLALSCRPCNIERGEKSWLEWKTIKSGDSYGY